MRKSELYDTMFYIHQYDAKNKLCATETLKITA